LIKQHDNQKNISNSNGAFLYHGIDDNPRIRINSNTGTDKHTVGVRELRDYL